MLRNHPFLPGGGQVRFKLAQWSSSKFEKSRNFISKTKSFLLEFIEGSSVHGFVYLGKCGLHFVERVLWMTCICIAFVGIASLSRRIWIRYQTSPIVVSMDRNKFEWNTTFPSLTICPHKKVDSSKIEIYIQKHPEKFKTDEDKTHFRYFIEVLANITFDNLDHIPINDSLGIPSTEYLDLIYALKFQFEPYGSASTSIDINLTETITERGICYAINSRVSAYNSYSYWKENRWEKLPIEKINMVHPLDGEVYGHLINISTSYDVFFHGPNEVPDMFRKRYSFMENEYTTVELMVLEIFASDQTKDFSIQQRKCRFPHESEKMISTPIYSFGLCQMECRMNLALKICDCIPHFYRNQIRKDKFIPVCDIEGLMCLSFVKEEIISLQSKSIKIDCDCYANCDNSNFFLESYTTRTWFLGANLQWGINNYPKMQLRRDVLFSFADVLVYIGGLVGFFLGCSILSLTEFIYYFAIRFLKRLLSK